jgi:hypothetical protein
MSLSSKCSRHNRTARTRTGEVFDTRDVADWWDRQRKASSGRRANPWAGSIAPSTRELPLSRTTMCAALTFDLNCWKISPAMPPNERRPRLSSRSARNGCWKSCTAYPSNRSGSSPAAATACAAPNDDGDILFIDTRVKTFVADAAYIFRYDGMVLIKRLQWIGNGNVRILSENSKYPPTEARLGDLDIGGRALAVLAFGEF